MGFFTKGSDADQALRDARRELDEQHASQKKALQAGDGAATAENMRLQDRVIEAERGASRGERFRR